MTSLISVLVLCLLLPFVHCNIWKQQLPIEQDDDLKVPGDNPLYYCEDTKDYILNIDHIDLDPNPPKA